MSRFYILCSLHLLIVQYMEDFIAFLAPSSKFPPVAPKATVSFVLL